MEAIVFQVAIFLRTFRTEFFKDTAMKEISVDSEENGRNRSNVSISSMFKATCNYAGSLKNMAAIYASNLCSKSSLKLFLKFILSCTNNEIARFGVRFVFIYLAGC